MSRHRWLLCCGAVAAAQMAVVSMVDGATRLGYDPYRNWVSQLALGPRGWLGLLNLALCGGWLVAYAAGLRRHLPASPAATRVVRLVLLCGAGFLLIAVVPIDPGLDYPPGVPAVHTAVGYLHQAGAVIVFAAGTAAAVLLGRCAGRPRPGLLVAAVMVVSFTGSAVLVTLDVLDVVVGSPSGLLERVALFTGLGWIGVVGLRLYRQG